MYAIENNNNIHRILLPARRRRRRSVYFIFRKMLCFKYNCMTFIKQIVCYSDAGLPFNILFNFRQKLNPYAMHEGAVGDCNDFIFGKTDGKLCCFLILLLPPNWKQAICF